MGFVDTDLNFCFDLILTHRLNFVLYRFTHAFSAEEIDRCFVVQDGTVSAPETVGSGMVHSVMEISLTRCTLLYKLPIFFRPKFWTVAFVGTHVMWKLGT